MSRAMEQMRNDADLAARKKAACRMIRAGKLSYEEIADYLELSLEDIKNLAKEVSGLVTA